MDWYGLYVRKGEPVFLFNLAAVNACAEQARKRSRRASTTFTRERTDPEIRIRNRVAVRTQKLD